MMMCLSLIVDSTKIENLGMFAHSFKNLVMEIGEIAVWPIYLHIKILTMELLGMHMLQRLIRNNLEGFVQGEIIER